jgi:hypothetical protein
MNPEVSGERNLNLLSDIFSVVGGYLPGKRKMGKNQTEQCFCFL